MIQTVNFSVENSAANDINQGSRPCQLLCLGCFVTNQPRLCTSSNSHAQLVDILFDGVSFRFSWEKGYGGVLPFHTLLLITSCTYFRYYLLFTKGRINAYYHSVPSTVIEMLNLAPFPIDVLRLTFVLRLKGVDIWSSDTCFESKRKLTSRLG